jgi:hypothetical protein
MQRREFFGFLGGLAVAGAARGSVGDGSSEAQRGLRALLVDRNGQPLPHEPVRVLAPGGGPVIYSGATDAEGHLALRARGHLPDGEYGILLADSSRAHPVRPTAPGQCAPAVRVNGRPEQRPQFTRRFPILPDSPARLGGRQFLKETAGLPISPNPLICWPGQVRPDPSRCPAGRPNREDRVFEEIARKGNVPDWTESWREIRLSHTDSRTGQTICGKVWVMPDYLSIGRALRVERGRVVSNHDYVRMPMSGYTAQKIANMYALMLPTEKVVDAVFEQADVQLQGAGLLPDGMMNHNQRFCVHEDLIEGFPAQDCTWHPRTGSEANGWDRSPLIATRTLTLQRPRGQLIAGHKKDVVVWWPLGGGDKWMDGEWLMFTGWNMQFGGNGRPLPRPGNWMRRAKDVGKHFAGYCDYSHGVRLMWPEMTVEGELKRVVDVLYDPKLAFLINNEGSPPRGRLPGYRIPAPREYKS